MLNDIVIKLITVLNTLYTTFVSPYMTQVISLLSTWNNYESTMRYYLQGVYFIIGKGLCMYIVSAFVVILAIRIVFAIINIVGQYVP